MFKEFEALVFSLHMQLFSQDLDATAFLILFCNLAKFRSAVTSRLSWKCFASLKTVVPKLFSYVCNENYFVFWTLYNINKSFSFSVYNSLYFSEVCSNFWCVYLIANFAICTRLCLWMLLLIHSATFY